MTTTKYLVDNNALLQLGAKRTATAFFSEHCRVPEEVAHEAGPRRAERLAPLTVPMTARVLYEVAAVMKTVPVGNRALVDLYGNKGAADPILVATAMVLNAPEKPSLFHDKWIIVTHDRAVRDTAAKFEIETATPNELGSDIDTAQFDTDSENPRS